MKRKEQECSTSNKYAIGFARKCQRLELDIFHLKDENNKLKCKEQKLLEAKEQECEELKREIAFGNNGKLSDKIRAIVFKDLNAENSNYKQALDEIEKYIKNQLDEFGNDVYNMDKSAINSIQSIINKAKDGE